MDRNNFITAMIKSRDVMYKNRDIVNGNEPSNEQHLTDDYLLGELNKVNIGETQIMAVILIKLERIIQVQPIL